MRCEVCGRKIHGKPIRVIIEKAKLTVCAECSKHGTVIQDEEPRLKTTILAQAKRIPTTIHVRSQPAPTVDTSLELGEGFPNKIREAREKLGLSHEELGKKLNEKVSLLRKIETGKMTPDNILATKLEHALKIKLIVPAATEKTTQVNIPKTQSRGLTLGDLVKLDEKDKEKKEEPAGRKQS